ncbi:MAG: DNA polymerase IV [Oscillospiraceae bacterium]|nr:DNA polymerase IV [Oscillospiraceae bacterium]
MTRTILHCDLNSFFASVELLSYPELRDKPVAVSGDASARHGIILAKNEAAKRCGVVTAETIYQARRKCPELVLLPPHHALYEEYSRRVNAIYAQYTDLVEPFGIDESWLDITGSCHLFGGDAVKIADELRTRVREELGLTLSVGVSFNKVFAKLGSDYRKPDATTLISKENWQKIVFPLPVTDLLFVGRAAADVLAQYGVHTVGQLAACRAEMLETLLGKLGLQLHAYANGLDDAPVIGADGREAVKSVGNRTTYSRDITRLADARTAITVLADSVAMRLRRHGMYCGGVQLTIRNAQFKNISRQKQLGFTTHLTREIAAAAVDLLKSAWREGEPIRMLTVTAIHLTAEKDAYCQLDLLSAGTPENERQEKVERAMDAIRKKYGKGSISFGAEALAENFGGGTGHE